MSALPWLAGWFEARGCIIMDCRESLNKRNGFFIRRDKFGVLLCVPEKLAHFLEATFGGSIQGTRPRRFSPGTREWRAHSADAASFLKAIEPHIRIRHAEFEAAFQFWGTMRERRRGRKVNPEILQRRIVAFEAFKAARIRRIDYAENRARKRELRKASGEA